MKLTSSMPRCRTCHFYLEGLNRCPHCGTYADAWRAREEVRAQEEADVRAGLIPALPIGYDPGA